MRRVCPAVHIFHHRARLDVAEKYVDMRCMMADVVGRNYRCEGCRRMRASLTRQYVNISQKIVQRPMKLECLVAATPERRRQGSCMGEISPVPDNLLKCDSSAAPANEEWRIAIAEFQTPACKLYRSPMIDCSVGMVVSSTIGTRLNSKLVNMMLDAAIETVTASNKRQIMHSDKTVKA